jgi:hypothetical protein
MQIFAPHSMLPHGEKMPRGEYDVDYASSAPVVVDPGAYVGSFRRVGVA